MTKRSRLLRFRRLWYPWSLFVRLRPPCRASDGRPFCDFLEMHFPASLRLFLEIPMSHKPSVGTRLVEVIYLNLPDSPRGHFHPGSAEQHFGPGHVTGIRTLPLRLSTKIRDSNSRCLRNNFAGPLGLAASTACEPVGDKRFEVLGAF
ncbi:hypothetical protein BKA93DRAFT_360266 [Sparassis latifolia]